MSYNCAVITISDKGYRGEREDTSGPAICALAEEKGFKVVYKTIVPDEAEMIKSELVKCADELKISLVLTTGGTGFSPRDITPEATLAVVERETRGIPEAMRAESLKITPRGCLSRSASGIRGSTLIINLPGSKKAALENLNAVIDAVEHGMDMLVSSGSADCASTDKPVMKKGALSMDAWLKEAKKSENADKCGMFLFHNGVVRATAKAEVRNGQENMPAVRGMVFDYDSEKVNAAVKKALTMDGIYYARVWLNRGELDVGDDIMLVLLGGDTRPHTVDALNALVGELKENCVTETEKY